MNCKDSNMHSRLMQRVWEIMMMDKESEEGARDLRGDTLTAFRHFELSSQQLSRSFLQLPVISDAKDGLLEVTASVYFETRPTYAAGWKLKSVVAGIDFRQMHKISDEQETALMFFEGERTDMNFRHYYDEQMLLFHGMCIEFYTYDALTDEYKVVKEKNVNAGFMRYIER